jgi:hypothetical protein
MMSRTSDNLKNLKVLNYFKLRHFHLTNALFAILHSSLKSRKSFSKY